MYRDRIRDIFLKTCNWLGRTTVFQRLPDQHNNIVMYHSVGGTGVADIPTELFRLHLSWLSSQYEIVDLPRALKGGEKKVALTFDDGYKNFYEKVVPLLREYSAPATVFVIADALKCGNFTHDVDKKGLGSKAYEYMNSRELREISEDPIIHIGSHTKTHPDLSKIHDEATLRTEIVRGTEIIESALGVSVDRFCYPYNRYSKRARDIASECMSYGVHRTGETTLLEEGHDPLLLPRISGDVELSSLKFRISDFSKRIRNT